MPPLALSYNDQQIHRVSQLLYQCLEDLGSTKAALYLAAPGTRDFRLVSHFGWPRATPPPSALGPADPLVLMVQRERRCFALNNGSDFPELHAFGQGKADPRYFIAPIYDHGEWIGLLLQRDLRGNEPYRPERLEAPTQAICQEIAQTLRQAALPPAVNPGPPAPVPAPAAGHSVAARPPELIRLPAPPTFPEQRSFFWEAAQMLFQVVPVEVVALWVHDPIEPRPILAFTAAPLAPQLVQQVLALARSQHPDLYDPRVELTTKVYAAESSPLQDPFRTLLPILLEEQFGKPDLLMLFRIGERPFLPHEQEFIRGVARLLGLYLQEGRLHERYHQSFLSVSHRILASADAKLPNLRAHSLNTAELSRSLARKLELSSPEVEAVTISAILHDVGTLLLDLRILDKPTLTAEELEQVQTHPILASTCLKGFHFPFDVLRIIRHHHERWDGKGYPDGIAGEAIPIESRIIHLVESFQVMTTGTAYRAAKPVPAALEELRQLSGLQYDPHMVEVFIKMVESGR
jgi:HD-GYP domain-containing protein (c-di-GMP phosphodiesterase class II)